MIPVPSWSLLAAATAGAIAALAVLIYPGAWLALVAFDVFLFAAALLDWLITPGPGKLEVGRLPCDTASVLTPRPVTVVIHNRSASRLTVTVRDKPPDSFTIDPPALDGDVPAQAEVRWRFRITPRSRGAFTWGPIYLRYRSLLGLWQMRARVEAPGKTRAYPALAELHRYHLLARAGRLEAIGLRRQRLRGSAWEFESLREYAFGDDTRLIDWKATARRRKTIVRNQESERNQTVLLLVDHGRLMNAEVDGILKLDHAVTGALLLAHVALTRGDRVGLCTFSSAVHAWVPPRAHRAHLHVIGETLYDLRGDFTETDHGRCLRLLASRHSKRALLIVITDFVDADTAADMVAHLQRAARRHLVLFVALNDPLLAVAARNRPATRFAGFKKSAAIELLRERRQVLQGLRQRGIHVLDVEPSQLAPPLINRYLEVACRGLL
jgi:uncharacterized protein (DUF58 family)